MTYFLSVFARLILLPFIYTTSFFLNTSSIRFGLDKAIGLIEVKGTLTDEARKETVKEFEQFRYNRSVKGIVLRIESPGGGVAAAQEICNEIKRVRESGKPVFASMGSIAASGGYYIAIPCDRIYANPGTITGSIGVIMEMPNVEELLKKVGVYFMVIKSKEHKDIGSPYREMTEEEKKLLKDVIDNVYNQFVDAIVLGRNLNRKDVLQIADGRVLTGEQAKELGLIDDIGDLHDAMFDLAKSLGIRGRPRIIKPRRKRPTLLELLGIKSTIDEYLNSINLEYK